MAIPKNDQGICRKCGKTFKRNSSAISRNQGFYCGATCYLSREPAPISVDLLLRKRVIDPDTGCWNIIAKTGRHPYVSLTIGGRGGRRVYAHRLSAHLYKGFELNNPLKVCHTCDNTRCVNPDHLFIGTQKENLQDAARKGRLRAQAHPELNRGEKSPGAKLTNEDVWAIRASSSPVRVLAQRYDVGKSAIHKIRAGDTWKHLSSPPD